MSAGQVVLAAGPWTAEIEGLPAGCARSACARSRARSCACAIPAGPGLVTRVVRFEGGYLVPRADGCYVLGATVEERGMS